MGGEAVKWNITEQGTRALVEVWRENDGAGLYKAYIAGNSGRFLLGTLMPENGRLYLKRLLSIDSLYRQGFWPIRQIREEMVCSFREQPKSVYWEDEVLRGSAKRLPHHTVRWDGDQFSLIFPFDPHAPFPLTPAFCFARVINSRLIFSFQSGGIPYIFRTHGKNRGEVKG